MKTFSFQLASIESELVFRKSSSSLPVKEITGFEPSSELKKYKVFADQEFNIGNAWYCRDSATGAVYRISPEFSDFPEFVNSSLKAFKASIQAAAYWSREYDSDAIKANPKSVDLLANALTKIDSDAMKSPQHHWPTLINLINDFVYDDDDELEFHFKTT